MLACLEACRKAVPEIQHCAAVCIKNGWRRKGRMLSLLCLDTADACEATLKALSRGSKNHGAFCSLSATLAQECAVACRHYAATSRCRMTLEACHACADACDKCAEACRNQAGEKHFLSITASCYLELRS